MYSPAFFRTSPTPFFSALCSHFTCNDNDTSDEQTYYPVLSMNTRTSKESALPKQQKQLSSKKSAPYSNKKNGSTPPPPLNDNSLVKSSAATVTLPPLQLQLHYNPTKISPQQAAKKEKTRQYNKAHREKLKRDGKLEDHKERIRQYNAKRRQALNTMARENGLSVRKMEQTLKETKKSTGVDLLSKAIHGEKKESYLHSKILPGKMISNDNTSLQHMTSCQPHRSNATDCTPNKANATAVAASQQQQHQTQPCPPSSSSTSPPPSLSNPSCDTGDNKMLRGEEQLLKATVEQNPAKNNDTPAVKKKNKRKATVSPDVTVVTTPANNNNKAKVARPTPTPARGGGQQQPTTPSQASTTTTSSTPAIVVETEKRKKDKHNHHNRVYRDKLKQDKRRYEEHKEKARQYNERRRKKLRAMAKEVGVSMKEMEKTIKEAKIISALTITASKEAETSSCCLLSTPQKDVPHVIGRVSPPQEEDEHHHDHHQRRERLNSLDILSNAASILLSQQPMSTDSSNATPSSPTRQFRAVSEDNFESD